MCGIAGIWRPQGGFDLGPIAESMASALTHRGPDDSGVWVDNEACIAMGHRRLSILDLSPAGHQPMISPDGRFVLVFNGEIYNHLSLRSQMSGARWLGGTDTETLLECIVRWGPVRALRAATGMFAFALWDRAARTLTLARDRFGEKPLYYGWQDGTFLFASELKALKSYPRFAPEVDRGALALLLRHNCVPAPYSIYSGISKLKPGHIVVIQDTKSPEVRPSAYWDLEEALPTAESFSELGDREAVEALESALTQSVRKQMVADVPVGAFLSGGVDSSTVVALMQAQSARPVQTFTIGSPNRDYDEAQHARAVASHLGTDHTEIIVSPESSLEVIPQLPSMFCEPFGDSSQIPTYLVSRAASGRVKVALSGDGGDELFGGYNRYLGARRTWQLASGLPPGLRKGLSRALGAVPPNRWDSAYRIIEPLIPAQIRLNNAGDKAHKLAGVLGAANGLDYYRCLTSHWADPTSIVLGSEEPPTAFTEDSFPASSFVEWMMAMDTKTYLADDILTKVDRAAMATSLETRVPLLDPDVVECAWKLPLHMKIRGNEGKWALRQVLYRHVPKELIERPKMGFGIPLGQWLRGPLREWAEELLDDKRIKGEGYFDANVIQDMWADHVQGKKNVEHKLWTILMFQAWLSEQ